MIVCAVNVAAILMNLIGIVWDTWDINNEGGYDTMHRVNWFVL